MPLKTHTGEVGRNDIKQIVKFRGEWQTSLKSPAPAPVLGWQTAPYGPKERRDRRELEMEVPLQAPGEEIFIQPGSHQGVELGMKDSF